MFLLRKVENWKVHVPGANSVAQHRQPRWKSVVRKIKQWMYSWMRPGYVESKEEYKISKLLLMQFVCSAAVLSAVGGHMYIITAILCFLQGHVFVHESLFLHYFCHKLRHFDVSHGSAHKVSVSCLLYYWFRHGLTDGHVVDDALVNRVPILAQRPTVRPCYQQCPWTQPLPTWAYRQT